jgi:DNA-binding Xre family transcriptional regulator
MLDMRLRLPELMHRRGLKGAYALAKASRGAIPISTAQRLVAGAMKRIDFGTLDVLCDVLDADPSELLERDKAKRR